MLLNACTVSNIRIAHISVPRTSLSPCRPQMQNELPALRALPTSRRQNCVRPPSRQSQEPRANAEDRTRNTEATPRPETKTCGLGSDKSEDLLKIVVLVQRGGAPEHWKATPSIFWLNDLSDSGYGLPCSSRSVLAARTIASKCSVEYESTLGERGSS